MDDLARSIRAGLEMRRFQQMRLAVMPALAGVNREYTYIQDYAALGAGFAEIIKTCLTRPLLRP